MVIKEKDCFTNFEKITRKENSIILSPGIFLIHKELDKFLTKLFTKLIENEKVIEKLEEKIAKKIYFEGSSKELRGLERKHRILNGYRDLCVNKMEMVILFLGEKNGNS